MIHIGSKQWKHFSFLSHRPKFLFLGKKIYIYFFHKTNVNWEKAIGNIWVCPPRVFCELIWNSSTFKPLKRVFFFLLKVQPYMFVCCLFFFILYLILYMYVPLVWCVEFINLYVFCCFFSSSKRVTVFFDRFSLIFSASPPPLALSLPHFRTFRNRK